MLIYKILRNAEWSELLTAGDTAGAPVDVADGFVHFSTAEQLPETLARHFTGESGLVALALETDALGAALKWEPSRGGALFPHLYGRLKLADVKWSAPVTLAPNGRHVLPDQIA